MNEQRTEGTIRSGNWLWLVIGISVVLLSCTLLSPLSVDNTIFQLLASGLVDQGWQHFALSWDQNFPVIVLPHALSILLFGNSDLSFHVFDLLIHLGAVLLLFKLLKRILSIEAAATASLLWIVYYVKGGINLYGQREAYCTVLLIGILWLITARENSGWKHYLISGLLAGLMVMTKPTNILIVLVLLWYVWKISANNNLRSVCYFLTGVITGVLIPLLPFLLIRNGLTEFITTRITFNLDVHTTITSSLHDLLVLVLQVKLLTLAVLLGTLVIILERKVKTKNREIQLYILLLIASVLGALLQGKYYNYQFDTFNSLLCLIGGYGVYWAFERTKTWSRISLSVVTMFFVIHHIIPPPVLSDFTKHLTDSPLESAYRAADPDPLSGYEVQCSVRDYLRKKKIKSIEIQCGEPLRLRVGTPSVTRFPWVPRFLTLSKQGRLEEYQLRWIEEFTHTLDSARPEMIVTPLPSDSLSQPAVRDLYRLVDFRRLLQDSYSPDTSIGGYQLFRRLS